MTNSNKYDEFNALREESARAKAEYVYLTSIGHIKFANRLSKNKYLYFIQCGDAVKIGISSDPEARLETLATGAPGKLNLIAMIPNAGDKEHECHEKMSHLNIHGEWFRYTTEIDALIKELQNEN